MDSFFEEHPRLASGLPLHAHTCANIPAHTKGHKHTHTSTIRVLILYTYTVKNRPIERKPFQVSWKFSRCAAWNHDSLWRCYIMKSFVNFSHEKMCIWRPQFSGGSVNQQYIKNQSLSCRWICSRDSSLSACYSTALQKPLLWKCMSPVPHISGATPFCYLSLSVLQDRSMTYGLRASGITLSISGFNLWCRWLLALRFCYW